MPQREPSSATAPVTLVGSRAAERSPPHPLSAHAAPRGLRTPRRPPMQHGGWGAAADGFPSAAVRRGGAADLFPSSAAWKGGICKPAYNSNAAVKGGGGEVKTVLHHQLNVSPQARICLKSICCPLLLRWGYVFVVCKNKDAMSFSLKNKTWWFFCGVLAFNSF